MRHCSYGCVYYYTLLIWVHCRNESKDNLQETITQSEKAARGSVNITMGKHSDSLTAINITRLHVKPTK